jgi:hypothetical protein
MAAAGRTDRRAEFSSDSFCRRSPAAPCHSLNPAVRDMAYEILNISYAISRTTSIQRAVVVAMIAVPMVQSAVENVIEMVAVRRHRVVTAVMAAVAGHRGASRRIHGGDFDDVFVVMIAMW